ncbi:hypothetical protein PDL71_15985 [Lacibacter sp. MH-610]|uniref:hypothetical protein n=1 Tax=Lacibacter sp. MH-610 TaxID=3020883 RepID=UPI003891F5AE
MFTPITQLWRQNSKAKILFFALCFSLLSLYPIYKNFYNGAAVTTYERHIALIEGRAEYYNPWQYRMLCPVLIEGFMWLYNHTIDVIYPIEEKINLSFTQTSVPTPETEQFFTLLKTKGALKYMIVFIAFRFLLNFLVFTLAFYVWHYFVKNKYLLLMGLVLLSLGMGNAVIASDLTFNTYLDNVFYLLAAIIILYKKNPLWLIPVTVLAAFNRETALLIPVLYFLSNLQLQNVSDKEFLRPLKILPEKKVWLLSVTLMVLFAVIFISLRMYYGFVPAKVWKVPAGPEMVKLNLLSTVAAKSYFEMLGIFSIIPLLILYRFKQFPRLLQFWFLGIVPIWFAVHIYSVVIYQTRLFLVPVILIFLPMFLWLIENNYRRKESED